MVPNEEQKLKECDPSTSFLIKSGRLYLFNDETDVDRSVATKV